MLTHLYIIKSILDSTISSPLSSSKESSCCSGGKIFQKLLKLNFFENDPPSTEKQLKDQEIVATRIYILLFILSMVIVLLYSGPFSNEIKSINLKNHSIDDIQESLSTKSFKSFMFLFESCYSLFKIFIN